MLIETIRNCFISFILSVLLQICFMFLYYKFVAQIDNRFFLKIYLGQFTDPWFYLKFMLIFLAVLTIVNVLDYEYDKIMDKKMRRMNRSLTCNDSERNSDDVFSHSMGAQEEFPNVLRHRNKLQINENSLEEVKEYETVVSPLRQKSEISEYCEENETLPFRQRQKSDISECSIEMEDETEESDANGNQKWKLN